MTKLNLIVKSNLLLGSGEGDGIIDTDIVFDQYGFPYIPGRRLKGLLRESALEVQEITCCQDLINRLFGDGNNYGKVRFPNLQIAEVEEATQYLNEYGEISKQDITSFFTTNIQQTSIDSGIAKEGSLRVYRVLKPNLKYSFESTLNLSKCTIAEESLLRLAIINLKHIGLRRNRGFGHIDLSLADNSSIDVLLKNLNENKENNDNETEINKKLKYENHDSIITTDDQSQYAELKYTVETCAPIIIAKQQGEQNTVTSEEYIPGSVIRGMLAEQMIHKYNLENAEQNKLFRAIFLSGNTKIKGAFLNSAIPVPACLKILKPETTINETAKSKLHNIFEDDNLGVTQSKKGWCTISESNVYEKTIQKQATFHSSRKESRLSGKNEDGAIFYYESILPNQTFEGSIIGPKNHLKSLITAFDPIFTTQIGRSHNAQFGSIQVSLHKLQDLEPLPTTHSNNLDLTKYMLICSPLIVHNENTGLSSASLNEIVKYLGLESAEKSKNDTSKQIQITPIINHALTTTMVENYVGVWKSKSPTEAAIAPGSVVKLKITQEKISEIERFGLGERTHEGYGQVRFLDLQSQCNFIEAKNKKAEKEDTPKQQEGLIKEIVNHTKYKQEIEEIRSIAIAEANTMQQDNLNKLNGHFLGRVLDLIRDSTALEQFLKELQVDEGKEKPFTQKLKSLGWHQYLTNSLEIPELSESSDKNPNVDFTNTTIRQEFWVTYLKALGKLLNKNTQTNGN